MKLCDEKTQPKKAAIGFITLRGVDASGQNYRWQRKTYNASFFLIQSHLEKLSLKILFDSSSELCILDQNSDI